MPRIQKAVKKANRLFGHIHGVLAQKLGDRLGLWSSRYKCMSEKEIRKPLW